MALLEFASLVTSRIKRLMRFHGSRSLHPISERQSDHKYWKGYPNFVLESIQQDQELLSKHPSLILLNAIYTPSHLVFLNKTLSKPIRKVQISSLKR